MNDGDGAERGPNENAATGEGGHGVGSGRNDGANEGNERRDRGDVLAVENVGQAAQDGGQDTLHQERALDDPAGERARTHVAHDEGDDGAGARDHEDLAHVSVFIITSGVGHNRDAMSHVRHPDH